MINSKYYEKFRFRYKAEGELVGMSIECYYMKMGVPSNFITIDNISW